MYKYHNLNPISQVGLDEFTKDYAPVSTPETADAILVRSAAMHEMEFAPDLKAIARAGAGVNNIPLEKCAEQGIVVFNTPGANANGVKELVIAGMLLASRDIIGGINWVQENEEDGNIAKDAEKAKKAFAGQELEGKKLGVIGLGAIGFAFAKMAQGFGMHVLAYSRHKKEGAAYDFIEQVSLDELLARSDFISLHTPHTPATERMIDQDTIARMKDGVVLINTARGALIDEQALADALASGKVLAAGLDVLTDEPPVCGSPLLTAPNTVITGHIAWLTRESRIRAIDMAIDNFRCYLEGHPVSIIN